MLDIGTDYRLRAISFVNPDYGQTSSGFTYYSNRATAHIGGRFAPNIEMMTQFQAISVVGSSGAVTNPTLSPAASRYPNTAFVPWVQWAYLRARHLYDTPMDLTIGRQPMLLGDGMILSDDDLGFTGVRLQSDLFGDVGLKGDFFVFRPYSSSALNATTDLYGTEISKPTKSVRYSLLYLLEHDGSGQTLYVRPSENPTSLPTTNLYASNIVREFYDARVEGRLLQGGFFKGEFAMQRGHVDRDPALGSVSLGGYGMSISAGLFAHTSKYGPIEVHGIFALGTGDSGGGTDKSFHPDFEHQYDGLERSGYGEFYGASLFSALSSSSNPRGLPPGYSGIRTIGGGITTHPTSLLSIGVDYFVYDAQQSAAPGTFANVTSATSLGSEFDVGAGFAYTNYLTFRASFAFFSPGSAYQNTSNARRYLIEAIGRF